MSCDMTAKVFVRGMGWSPRASLGERSIRRARGYLRRVGAYPHPLNKAELYKLLSGFAFIYFFSFPPSSNFVIGSLYPAYLPPHHQTENRVGREELPPSSPS